MRRWICPVLILALIIVAAPFTPSSHAQDGGEPTYELFYCPFPIPEGETEDGDNITLDCGYLYVPQDRSDPDGLEIELAFAYLHSRSDNPHPAPIVYLEGGPGGSALTGIDLWVDSPFRDEYDIILLDQRGTGYSYPRLSCYEVDDLEFEEFGSIDEEDAAYVNALEACQARFEDEGIDISDYTTATNAADVADLRIALELDEINLYGVSYGTRLALTVMRDYPEGIRSVILDSTYPPVVDGYNEQAINGYRSFQELFTDCAADAECNAAFPDLENDFYALVDDLNIAPILIDGEFELTGDSLVNEMFSMFYSGGTVPYMPLMITELGQDITDTYLGLSDGSLPPLDEEFFDDDDLAYAFVDELFYLAEDLDDTEYDVFAEIEPYDLNSLAIWIEDVFEVDDANYLLGLLDEMTQEEQDAASFYIWDEDVSDTQGMYDAVECNDEIPFNDLDSVELLSAEIPEIMREALIFDIAAQFETCALWDSGTADASEDEAVASDIPTLVLAGEYDPITPPIWGQTAAETLSNGYYFEFPGIGHGVIDGGDCPNMMILEFYDNPTVAPDSSCIASMSSIEFVIG